eukprot:4863087-Pleurochrysis_carterae.AAC.1
MNIEACRVPSLPLSAKRRHRRCMQSAADTAVCTVSQPPLHVERRLRRRLHSAVVATACKTLQTVAVICLAPSPPSAKRRRRHCLPSVIDVAVAKCRRRCCQQSAA